ncbi:uncharacterized protein LOC126473967 isoform X2 [Schistocerca serialis cubense]|uniref:uncharacterized protein LOC126473967 isoform X2 n=1 Tax=Schistocerca serialis cubense TaxID=2023355 RepID=UPI00214E82BA|nr:uncharacterized protein LOC126473967 isoform X2 [Schistocerca serialis cubense]
MCLKASFYAFAAADHILQSVISPVTNDLSVELFPNLFAWYVKGGLNANTISLIMSIYAAKLNKVSFYAFAAADHILQSIVSPVTNDLSVELFPNLFAWYVKGGLNANTISLIMSIYAAKLNKASFYAFAAADHILQSIVSPVTNDLSVELFANLFAWYVKGGLNAKRISLIMSRGATKLNKERIQMAIFCALAVAAHILQSIIYPGISGLSVALFVSSFVFYVETHLSTATISLNT